MVEDVRRLHSFLHMTNISCGVAQFDMLQPKVGDAWSGTLRMRCFEEYLYDLTFFTRDFSAFVQGRPEEDPGRGLSETPYKFLGDKFPFILFSDSDTLGHGIAFVDFLTKNNLGPVSEAAVGINGNSGNNIRVWVWTWDKTAVYALVDKWLAAGKPDKRPPVDEISL